MSEPQDPSKVVDLLPWDLTLRRAVSRRRAVDILDREDADEAIRALTEVEAYHAVKTLGPSDAGPLLALMTPAQTQALLDLDVWHGDDLDIPDLMVWFEAFRSAGMESLVKAARALDPEALAMFLRRRLLICFTPKDDVSDQDEVPDWAIEPDDDILPLVKTDDGRFIIAARAVDESEDGDVKLDEDERKAVLQLVAELYKDEDWEYVAGILRLAQSDLSSALHADALRFRNARLEDLGFPPFERAMEVYGPLDPAVLAEPVQSYPTLETQLPAEWLAPLSEGLFHEAMRRIQSPAVVRRIEGDLVPLANAALVADGAEPGDLAHLQDTLGRARGYIQLALAHGTTDPVERVQTAAERLTHHHVTTLFRVGYTLTTRAATRARVLTRLACFAHEDRALARLEDPERGVLEALSARRPRFYEGLQVISDALARQDTPSARDVLVSDEERGFSAPEDLAAAELVLTDLEALAQALVARRAPLEAALAVPALLPAAERTAMVFVATLAARALRLSEPLQLGPVTAEALADLADRLARAGGPAFEPTEVVYAQEAVADWFGAGQSAIEARVRVALDQLASVLWPLVGSPIDPRFVPGLLVEP